MVNIIKESSSFVIQGDVNSYPFKDGKISLPLNSLYFVIDESNVISFKQVNDNNTLLSVNINNLQINGEEVTKENLIEKFDAVANGSMGGTKLNAGTNITLQPQEDGSITISATGELGGTVAWADVTEKPSTFTPSAHTHLSADITDLQGKLDAKQDTLVSGTNIKTINGQDILGEGNITIEGGTGDVTQQYVDEQLALKVDKTAYEADKETFALKTEIPSIEGLASKEELQNGLDGKQDKGDYALKSELSGKQDTLVSGTNIKTVNGQTLLGEGNIEIQGGGSGISDAPSDDKLYGRKNANWSEIIIPSTDNLATKEELNAKANLDGANFTGGVVVPDLSINNSTKGVMFNVSNQSNDILFRTLNAGIDSVSFQVQNAYPLKLTEAGIMENNQLLENKYAKIDDIPTKVSDLENDSGFITNTEASNSYQAKGEYATTSQLSAKLDTSTYTEDKATFATKEELAGKANTSDLSNYLQTSVAESTYAKKSEIPEEYTLPIATAEALGGIKVGAGLSINPATGVLSATGGGTADSVDWANITSKPETFTPSAHNHPISEVTELQDKLDEKADKTAIADMATKTWVGEQGYLTAVPEEYVTETELSGKGYLTAIPEEYVTNEELTSALSSKQDKGNYITVETADGKYQVKGDYATTAQLANKVDTSAYTEDKATFALKSELTNLATKAELNLKANTSDLSNYLTTTDAESNYAKKSEIPSLEGYLEASVADEKYATKTELEGKVDDADIADMATQTWVTSQGYLTSVPAEYVTETELDAKGYKKIEYLTQSQYDELPIKEEGVMYVITDAPEVVIPDTSTFATKAELATKQDNLVSGTNIKTVNGESILGSGNIVIEGGSSEPTEFIRAINTVNAENIFGFTAIDGTGDGAKYPYKLTSRNGIKITQDNNNAAFIEPDTEVLLTKTEASTTYALQSALQSALDRISALEAQVGNISTQLDNINGEVIN